MIIYICGGSIVRSFLKHGAKVCVADGRDPDDLSLVGNNNVSFVRCDVTAEDDVRRAVDHAVERFGGLDVMVNNAGVLGPTTCRDIREFDVAELDRVFGGEREGRVPGDDAHGAHHDPEGKWVDSVLVQRGGGSGRDGRSRVRGMEEDEMVERMRWLNESVANLKGVELTVDDVACAVVFLANDGARYVSGANLMVDGGFTSTHTFEQLLR
ncbi:Xanthoxin dehydrogenase [Striga hermonthica]|uniref:Xanthoxin dehydrogenase n=1 Tax=Striga hermonthica TaxID=68872 RepID=A0A9N7MLF5_STRHE|nr:Xanthoxin dehydrogenase [Striga hermonthica]